jgi:hypothetical protein
VADTQNHTIRKIATAGAVGTFAGIVRSWGSADGTGAAARFAAPYGVSVDAFGNVYVADTVNHTIRKITPVGVVSTLAGTAGSSGSADGIGSAGLTSACAHGRELLNVLVGQGVSDDKTEQRHDENRGGEESREEDFAMHEEI